MSALEKSKERRQFRRISDAIALTIRVIDEAANDQDYEAFELPDFPTHVVSLSPNGLKCYHSEAFNDVDKLQLSIKLFPGGDRIETEAVVVNSGEDEAKRRIHAILRVFLSWVLMSTTASCC